ncbi:MAG: YneF family protein [Erysipelotrichales bacterium]
MEIFTIIISLIVGGAIGFFLTRRQFKKELEKNPPVNEKMIRAMYMQMGRKPSEAQIKQTMKAMNQHK